MQYNINYTSYSRLDDQSWETGKKGRRKEGKKKHHAIVNITRRTGSIEKIYPSGTDDERKRSVTGKTPKTLYNTGCRASPFLLSMTKGRRADEASSSSSSSSAHIRPSSPLHWTGGLTYCPIRIASACLVRNLI